jgi:type IV pilus assembly protein PilN
MIRINLLPHREEKRKRRQQQFGVLAGFSAIVAAAVVGVVYLYLDNQVSQQRANVAYMKSEIDKLDKQIEEIRKIRE